MENFVEELRWRGMIHDMKPETEGLFKQGIVTAYVGIDPTADSLHIGHLVSIMAMMHMQRCGHKPIILLGGATGMIGDPSGKSQERNLLDEETLRSYQAGIREQLNKLIDFESDAPNAAIMVNNYDWMRNMGFLDFIRDVGKHITVNYMMAKDSVKKRLDGEGEGMSFTEFTYQLVQGYDFLHLFKEYGCKLQFGGSDQWGNITTGTEMIRRILGKEAFGLTWPLITKADGGKFGKTEKGNIWLDSKYTTPYMFYQFWLNVSDEDAKRYIKIFTMLSKEQIDSAIEEHDKEPHMRGLQKLLAKEITLMVHGEQEYVNAVNASEILFGKATSDVLRSLDEQTFLSVFEGVPQDVLDKSLIPQNVIELLAVHSSVFPSKGECRKLIQGGGLAINKDKSPDIDRVISTEDLLGGKYLLIQKGKKNYHILKFE